MNGHPRAPTDTIFFRQNATPGGSSSKLAVPHIMRVNRGNDLRIVDGGRPDLSHPQAELQHGPSHCCCAVTECSMTRIDLTFTGRHPAR